MEKKVLELSKDIEIHKEVELSLAEKNKKLKSENTKLKNNNKLNNTSNENNINSKIISTTEDEKSSDNRGPFTSSNINNSTTAENNSSVLNKNNNIFSNNSYTRMLSLEKKVLNLEKKLTISKKDYNSLKDKNEYIEKILKNYEKQYSGLFNFFEDCLNQFFNDEELANNQDIFVNIDTIQRCDFSALNKEEKYSALVILMKYLMPLINSSDVLNQPNNINNVNLKFHLSKKRKFSEDMNFVKNKKKYGKNLAISTNNDNIGGKTGGDVLPSITTNNHANGNI